LGNASVSVSRLQIRRRRHERGEPIPAPAQGGYLSVDYLSHRCLAVINAEGFKSSAQAAAPAITPDADDFLAKFDATANLVPSTIFESKGNVGIAQPLHWHPCM